MLAGPALLRDEGKIAHGFASSNKIPLHFGTALEYKKYSPKYENIKRERYKKNFSYGLSSLDKGI